MEGLGVEAARQLAAATTQLQQLECEKQSGASKMLRMQQQLKEKKQQVAQFRRARDEHLRHHDALLQALETLNEKNQKLQKDIRTKHEMRSNLVAHRDEMAALHGHIAHDLDKSAMNIQVLSAQLEASGIHSMHEASVLRELRHKKADADKQAQRQSHDLSRLRVHAEKAQFESLYVQRTLTSHSASQHQGYWLAGGQASQPSTAGAGGSGMAAFPQQAAYATPLNTTHLQQQQPTTYYFAQQQQQQQPMMTYTVVQSPDGTQHIVQQQQQPQYMWMPQQQQLAGGPQQLFSPGGSLVQPMNSGNQQQQQPTYFVLQQPNMHAQPATSGSNNTPPNSMQQPIYLPMMPQGVASHPQQQLSSLPTPGAGFNPPHQVTYMQPPAASQQKSMRGGSMKLPPSVPSMSMASSGYTQQTSHSNFSAGASSRGRGAGGGGSSMPMTHASEQPTPGVIHSVRPFLGPKCIGSILEAPSKLPLLDTLPPMARRRPPPMKLPEQLA